MLATLNKVGSAPHHEFFTGSADDILVVVPEPGFKDTAEASRVTVIFLLEYARKLGKKCGLVIVANNLLAQDPESRRIYATKVTPDLFYGIAMVVNSPLTRMIGNLALHLNTLQVPISLFDSIESSSAWLATLRNKA
jgi:hypothetical protein